MKRIKATVYSLCLLSFFTGTSIQVLHAQDKKLDVKALVDSPKFVFHAQAAMPSSGPTKQLTSEYDLRVSKNSVESHLPYFGRAYSAPYGGTDGGFNFTSTKFDYKTKPRKKGGWEISIKPKDIADMREFHLTISENGYGSLQAFSNNRRPITFTGYVTELKNGKKE